LRRLQWRATRAEHGRGVALNVIDAVKNHHRTRPHLDPLTAGKPNAPLVLRLHGFAESMHRGVRN
jgi:hypothetical protein